MFNKVFASVAIDPAEEDCLGAEALPHTLSNHVFEDAACIIPLRGRKQEAYHLVSRGCACLLVLVKLSKLSELRGRSSSLFVVWNQHWVKCGYQLILTKEVLIRGFGVGFNN